MTSLVDISPAQSATLVAAPLITSVALTVSSIASGSFSVNMMLCLVATESLANMQYLNINHSNIASTIYAGMASSYIPNWIDSFNTLERELIIFNWGIFEKNQISALLLDNFGDALTELMIYLGLFILSTLLTISPKTFGSFGEKAHLTTFGFFVANILGKIQSQILFSILQLIKFNLLLDVYSSLSLFISVSIASLTMGMLIFCFVKLLSLFNYQNTLGDTESSRRHRSKNIHIQMRWLQKKYEFMIGDFKHSKKNQFFFAYWITAFNAAYILLIFCLQTAPIPQCASIALLIVSFMLFSARIRPFESKIPAFLHFFNFGCVLIAAILNLAQAFAATGTLEFEQTETLGSAIVAVIGINTGINTLLSLGLMILEIYNKIKLACSNKSNNKENVTEKKPKVIEISSSSQINSTQSQQRLESQSLSISTLSNGAIDPNLSGTNLINGKIARPRPRPQAQVKNTIILSNLNNRFHQMSTHRKFIRRQEGATIIQF